MNNGYYAGHSFEWMQKFLNTIPRKKGLSKTNGYAIASCLHHQCIYSKQQVFKLNHRLLKHFGINRKSLPIYLTFFKNAELINYRIKKGSLPIINLLELPYTNYKINKSNLKIYNIKGTGVQTRTGDVSKQGQVGKSVSRKLTKEGREPRKEENLGRKEGKEGREPRKEGKEPRTVRNLGGWRGC